MHLQGHRCFTLHPVCSIYLIYTSTLLLKLLSPAATYTEAQHTLFEISYPLLDSFEKFLKATVSFTMSVRLSVWNNYSHTGCNFLIFCIFARCENVYRWFQFYESLTRITSTLHEDKLTFTVISHSVILSNIFKNLAVYEIMWKNIVETGRSQMELRRTRIACRIPNDAGPLSGYIILIAFLLQL